MVAPALLNADASCVIDDAELGRQLAGTAGCVGWQSLRQELCPRRSFLPCRSQRGRPGFGTLARISGRGARRAPASAQEGARRAPLPIRWTLNSGDLYLML